MSRAIEQLLCDIAEETQKARELVARDPATAAWTAMAMLEAMRGRAEALAAVIEMMAEAES